jgi:hypothetical protein
VILFGATGMVGQGVLRECLLDPEVETVLALWRKPHGKQGAAKRILESRDINDICERRAKSELP